MPVSRQRKKKSEPAERCVPYLRGQAHPQLGDDDTKVDHLARVIE